METTICLSKTVLTPNPLSLSTQYSNNPLFPSFKYSNNPLFPSFKYPTPTHPNHTTIIRSAISRTKKEETVETVKTHLQNCHLFAAINYKGFSVKHFQQLRNTLPSNTKLIVAKNRLVLRAIDNTKWEAMKPCLKGMNAWLFVHTEEIPLALKPYRTFLKENKLDHNDFTGGCFDGKFYGPNDIKSLETLPSRNEVYANLLGSLKTPSTALVGTLQAPARDLVLVLMAYVKKLEDEQGQGQ